MVYHNDKRSFAAIHIDTLEDRVLLTVPPVSFADRVDYTTSAYPNSVAAVDLNGDGAIDLVVADHTASKLNVLMNQGSGTFAAKVDYVACLHVICVKTIDLNGDRKPDLVFDNSIGTVSIMLNKGDGTFSSRVDYSVGSFLSRGLTVADFDGDGKADIAVITGSGLSILFNQGNGTLSSMQSIVTTYANAIAAADVNGDGKADLVTATADDVANVFLNDGHGNFAPGVSYPTGPYPTSVAAEDFNGDGRADLAVVDADNSTVSVLLNSGNGTFAPKIDYSVGNYPFPTWVTTGDFNSDGKPDLAIVEQEGYTNPGTSSDTVSVLLNNGDGSFAAGSYIHTGSYPSSITSADFNKDGKPDLAVVNEESNTISVVFNTTVAIADVTPPTVTAVSPLGYVTSNLSSFQVTFSESIKTSTFTPSVVTITGPMGSVSTSAISVSTTDGLTFTISFPTQSVDGVYTLTLASTITDLSANPLAAPYIGRVTLDKTVPAITGFIVSDAQRQRSIITSLAIVLSEDVTPAPAGGMLRLHNEQSGLDVNLSAAAFSYDIAARVARWDVKALHLADGNYTAYFTTAGMQDQAGNVLNSGAVYSAGFFALAGDADGSGDVDQSDFKLWYDCYGTANMAGDLNADGRIDQDDYAVWYNGYGHTKMVLTPTSVDAGMSPSSTQPPVLTTAPAIAEIPVTHTGAADSLQIAAAPTSSVASPMARPVGRPTPANRWALQSDYAPINRQRITAGWLQARDSSDDGIFDLLGRHKPLFMKM